MVQNAEFKSATLEEIERIFDSPQDITDVFHQFADLVRALIPFDRIALSITSPSQDNPKRSFAEGVHMPGYENGVVQSATQYMNDYVYRTLVNESPMLIDEENADEIANISPSQEIANGAKLRSMLAVPLVIEAECYGILALRSLTPNAYNQHQLGILVMIGSQIVGAIAKAQNDEMRYRGLTPYDAFAEITRLVSTCETVGDVYEPLTDIVKKLIPFDRITLISRHPGSNRRRRAFVRGIEMPGYQGGNVQSDEDFRDDYLYGQLTRHQSSLIVGEDSADEIATISNVQATANVAGLRSMIATPLLLNANCFGELILRSLTPNAYDEKDLEVLTKIAAHVVGLYANSQGTEIREEIASDLKESQDTLYEKLQEQRILARIGRIVNSSRNLDEAYGKIAKEIKRVVPFDRFSVMSLRASSASMVHDYTEGIELNGRRQGDEIPFEYMMSKNVAKSKVGEIFTHNPVDSLPRDRTDPSEGNFSKLKSVLIAPMVSDNEIIGALIFKSCTENIYKDSHLTFAQSVANQITDSIVKAQLHRELQKESHLLEVLGEIGKSITSSQDFELIYERFAEQVLRIIPFDRITISDVNMAQNTTVHRYTSGLEIPNRPNGWKGELRGFIAEACNSGQIVSFIPKTESEFFERFPPDTKNYQCGLRSFLAVPINFGTEVIGYLHLQSKTSGFYTHQHEEIGRRIVSHISGAMMRQNLYDTAEQTAKEQKLLADLSRIITGSLNLGSTIKCFMDRLRQDVPFDRFVMTEIDHQTRTYSHYYSDGLDVQGQSKGNGHTYSLHDTMVELLGNSVSTLVIQGMTKNEVMARYPNLLKSSNELGLQSFLFLPLVSDSKVIGALSMASMEANAYSQPSINLVERVAYQIAGALANSQLHADLARESEERALLAEVGRIISSSPDIEDVFDQFANAVKKHIKFDRLVVIECDVESDEGRYLLSKGGKVAGKQTNDTFSIKNAAAADIINSQSAGTIIQGSKLDAMTSKYPLFAQTVKAGYKSFLTTPLDLRGNKKAVLALISSEPEAYTEANLSLAQRIALQIAGIIANYRLNEELEYESKEREILAEIGRTAASSLDLRDVYDKIESSLKEVLECDRVVISLFNLGERQIVSRFTTRLDGLAEVNQLADDIPFENSLTGTVAISNSPILKQADSEGNVEDDLSGLLYARRMGLQSSLGVPLRNNDEIIGVLKIHSKSPSAFSPRDVYLVERIGNQIAGPMANSDLYRQLEKEALDRQAIAEIGRSAASSLNLDEVYENVNQTLSQLIPFDRMTMSLIDAGRKTTVRAYVSDPALSNMTLGGLGPFSGTAAEIVARTSQAIIVSEAMIDSVAELYPELSDTAACYRSLMLIPILTNKSVIAVLGLRKKEPNVYNDRHLELGVAVATHLASAIINAELHDDVEQEAKEKDVLAKLSRILNSSPDLPDVYERFAEVLRQLLPFDRISIRTVDKANGCLTYEYVQGIGDDNWQQYRAATAIEGTIASQVIQTRTGLTVNAEMLDKEIQLFPNWAGDKTQDIRSVIIVPLISEDAVIGLLSVSSVEPDFYSNQNLHFAEHVAEQISGTFAWSMKSKLLQERNSELRALSSRVVEVQERERRYIANELHDEVGQILTGVRLNLESSLKVLVGQSKSQVSDSIDLITDLTNRVRDLSLELRPAVLDDLGLLPALQSHIRRYFAQTGVKVNFKHRGLERRFSSVVETAAYRIVQEALTNIARYSGAYQAFIKVYVNGDTLLLCIEDRGSGFDVDKVIALGRASGLAGMRERVTSLSGVFRIESRPGVGTEIAVEMPLNSEWE